MAKCIIGPGTDIKKLRRELKKIGFVLRCYHGAEGQPTYRIHVNPYAETADYGALAAILKGGNE